MRDSAYSRARRNFAELESQLDDLIISAQRFQEALPEMLEQALKGCVPQSSTPPGGQDIPGYESLKTSTTLFPQFSEDVSYMSVPQQIPAGHRVRISDPEAVLYDSYGTVVVCNSPECTASGDYLVDVWQESNLIHYHREEIEDVTHLVTVDNEALKQAAPEPEWDLGLPVYHPGVDGSFVVRTAHLAPYQGWTYGLSKIWEQEVCINAREKVLWPYSEAPGLTLTRREVEQWAGRRLSDDDLTHLAASIPKSSIPDAVNVIITAGDDHGLR